jgi:hypothetical protein
MPILGGSPNYRDGKGLTPLYLSVLGPTDPQLTQVRVHTVCIGNELTPVYLSVLGPTDPQLTQVRVHMYWSTNCHLSTCLYWVRLTHS